MKTQCVISLLTIWFCLPLCGADKAAGYIAELRAKSEKGDAKAAYTLGLMYATGTGGVFQLEDEGLRLLRLSAKRGYAPAEKALKNLMNGHPVVEETAEINEKPKPLPKDFSDLKALAEKGDASAQHKLGDRYYFGRGVKKDFAETAKWYRKAAEQGYEKARFSLGCMYRDGKGVEQDHKEAVKLFRKAAEQGDALAQVGLGRMYSTGRGVEQDHKEAVKWTRKAAEQGNTLAQSNLGGMYYNGEGAGKDIARAYLWWSLAAEQDHEEAKKWKKKAADKLTLGEINKYDKWLKEWSARKLARGWPENPQETQGPFSALEKKFGFRVHYKEGDIFTGDSNSEDCSAKTIKPDELKRLPKILEFALKDYPTWVVRKCLNRVRFVEDLSYKGKKTVFGLANISDNSIYVEVGDNKEAHTDKEVEGVFHHEFATFLMEIHDFPTNEWTKCNPAGFEYEDEEGHGVNVLGKKRGPEEEFWPLGFVRGYSQASLDNDFENFSALIFTEPRKAKLLIDHFPMLKDKYHLWLKVHQKIDGNFFTEEQLFPKNLFAQKQPEKVEEIEILEIKDTHYCLPTGKPYSGKTVNFRDKEKTQKKYETLYREGKEVSESWFWYHKEGWLSQEALYHNDTKTSATYFYPTGKKKAQHTYNILGKLEGLTTYWYPNGKNEKQLTYKDGKKEGNATYWDEEDRVDQKAVFQNDKKISTTYFYWYPNGKRKIERPFKNGKEEGLSTYWYPNGKNEKQLTYKTGKLDGLSTWWYDNGNKQIEAMYQSGNEIRSKTIFWKPDGTPK